MIIPLSKIKKQITEENIERLYGKSLKEVIVDINPYKFNPSLMELYFETFYSSIYEFVNFGGFIVPPLYEKFLKGDNFNEFFRWFKEDVEKRFHSKAVDIVKNQ